MLLYSYHVMIRTRNIPGLRWSNGLKRHGASHRLASNHVRADRSGKKFVRSTVDLTNKTCL